MAKPVKSSYAQIIINGFLYAQRNAEFRGMHIFSVQIKRECTVNAYIPAQPKKVVDFMVKCKYAGN